MGEGLDRGTERLEGMLALRRVRVGEASIAIVLATAS
jgi:hypothetical protein